MDTIGALFPSSAADANSLIDLYVVFGRVRHLDYIECMRQAGFEVMPLAAESNEFHNRFYDFPDLEAIAEEGFAFTYE